MRGLLLLAALASSHALRLLPQVPRTVAVWPRMNIRLACSASWAATPALLLGTPAALAVDAADAASDLPDDTFVVAFAVGLLVLIGLLNLSLGDIAADEAQLPSSVNLINKARQRRSTFIKGGKRD